MFDKLVESAKQKYGRRTGSYLAATGAIYASALLIFGVGAIIGFSPVLAEEFSLKAMVAPPPPVGPPPPQVTRHLARLTAVANTFRPPATPTRILPANEVSSYPLNLTRPLVHGAPFGGGDFNGSVIGGRESGEPAPPPPPLKPTPKIEPAQPQEIKPGTRRVSEGVLQGSAIRRIKPIYPIIAKRARTGGPVQVLVTISEDGRVIEATAVSGNPLLRSVAVEAARQWLFSPTTLGNVPVKVQGVLTFNFVLE